jgi:invasion protein IalB
MKKYLNITIIFFILLSSSNIFAEEAWKIIKSNEYCYIQSIPIKTLIPEGKSRGNHGLIVYRMHKSSELFLQITAGFNYKSPESVEVQIDDEKFEFYSDASDTAWAKDDKKIINAMKKGLSFVTTGVSSKGTKVIDTYTLKGFTSAVNKLSNGC